MSNLKFLGQLLSATSVPACFGSAEREGLMSRDPLRSRPNSLYRYWLDMGNNHSLKTALVQTDSLSGQLQCEQGGFAIPMPGLLSEPLTLFKD